MARWKLHFREDLTLGSMWVSGWKTCPKGIGKCKVASYYYNLRTFITLLLLSEEQQSTFSMEAITFILYLYWISDVLLVLFGIPHTFEWIKPPKILVELFHYGKCRDGQVESSLVKFIEIPKAWFKHYYIYGVVVSAYMVAVTFGCFVFEHDIPGREILVDLIGSNRNIVVDQYGVMIVCVMMLIQHTRRIYECVFVSVYSKGTMNILHYLLGVLLYSTVQICAICDGPTLNHVKQDSDNIKLLGNWQQMDVIAIATTHWNKFLGIALFVWASYYHHHTHVILGELRKSRSGQVLHRQHVIPRGGLFKYLSAPHFVCEILIYIAMGIVTLNSCAFWMGPVLFTFTNQALMVNETHKWYKKTFKDYPNRYRFIPFVLWSCRSMICNG